MDHDRDAASVVDFARTARRLRAVGIVLVAAAIALWPVVGSLRGTGVSVSLLGELVGWAVLVAVALEVVIVAGTALAGMLRAGSRGDRLAGPDVSLVPPQLARRRRRRRGD